MGSEFNPADVKVEIAPPVESPSAAVLGTRVAVIDCAGAVAWAKNAALARDRCWTIAAMNTHGITLARTDQRFGNALRGFDLILPEGMPLWPEAKRG